MSSQQIPPPDSIFLRWGRFQLIVNGRLALTAVVVVSIATVLAIWLNTLR
jgi:hypothetical protein